MFFKRLLYFLPIPLIMLSVNFIKDPANLFNAKYEAGIADYLVQGYNVTNVRNYNERLLQKFFIEKMNTCPTEIILGSSRVMQVKATDTKNPGFINNGVSAASLEDMMAIYYLYEKKGCKIKKVIMGLDPWLINDNHDQQKWKSLATEYNKFSAQLIKSHPFNASLSRFYQYERLSELLSFSYFQTSVSYIIKGVDKTYEPTTKIENEGFTKLKDGSIFYDRPYREVSLMEVDDKAKSVIKEKPVKACGNFTNLSEHYRGIFTKFVEHLQSKGIEVEFFMSPFHPIVYDFFRKNTVYQNVLGAEAYFRDYAKKRKIKVFGSYNPRDYNFDSSYFLDGLHCTDKARTIILKKEITL
ncbi:hypothetical protein WG906_03795 [Pedobacter sp. P351]|uniref:hypothetical protein n=1 Tax=Pedobacter superstes TaxID=3133441 RepID=UPI0030A61B4D